MRVRPIVAVDRLSASQLEHQRNRRRRWQRVRRDAEINETRRERERQLSIH